MSFKLHAKTQQHSYLITGPIGYGLSPSPSGVHIAFAGGTGVLTFIDFVAKIARDVLKIMQAAPLQSDLKKSTTFSSEQRLILYVSFLNEQQAIGLRLCRALDRFCEKHNLNNFRLITRFSFRDGLTGLRFFGSSSFKKWGSTRWDEKFIRDALDEFADGEIQKVWCCGPPPMSETFDKTFYSIAQENYKGLTKQQLHVF